MGDWNDVVKKQVISKDTQELGKVIRETNGILIVKNDSHIKLKIRKTDVAGFSGKRLLLNITGAEALLTCRIDDDAIRPNSKEKVLVSAGSILSFLLVSYFFYALFRTFGLSTEVIAALSIAAGAFTSFIIISTSGLIKELSVKGGLFEFSSKIADKIEEVKSDVAESKIEVKSDVAESKREIGEMISSLNLNIQSMENRIENRVGISNRVNQNSTTNFDLGKAFTVVFEWAKSERSRIFQEVGIEPTLRFNKTIPEEKKERLDRIMDLQKATQLMPEMDQDIEEKMRVANYLFYTGKYDDASKIYEKILSQFPENVNALVNKGIVSYRGGKLYESLSLFDKAIALDGNNSRALIYKFFVLNRLGYIEERFKNERDKFKNELSKKIFDLKIDENSIDEVVNKGLALEFLDFREEANSIYKKVVERKIEAEDIDSLINQGIALDRLNKREDAIELYNKALTIDKQNVFALYSKACSCAILERTDDAIDLLREIFQISPSYRMVVKTDSDFEKLQNDDRWKSLF